MARCHHPWIRYDRNLFVVPSVHYRQVFAQLVLEACWHVPFDVLALELPRSWGRGAMLRTIRERLPGTGAIVRVDGRRARRSLPVDDHPDCDETEEREAELGAICPVTPSDSLLAAIRSPDLLADRHPGWSPEVACIDAEPGGRRPRRAKRGRVEPFDDHAVNLHGLESFCRRREAAWEAARDDAVDLERERVMASRLATILDDPSRKVLFVCGAAHWRSIQGLLDAGYRREEPAPEEATPEEETPEEGCAPLFVPVRPEVAWYQGWLDDLPCCVADFETAWREGRGPEFDRAAATGAVLPAAIEAARRRGVGPSVRQSLVLDRFLTRLISTGQRWLPTLARELEPAATSCVSRRFATVVRETALRFPFTPPPRGGDPFVTRVGDEYVLVANGRTFVLRPAHGDASSPGLPIPWRDPTGEDPEADDGSGGFGRHDGAHGFRRHAADPRGGCADRGFVPEERDLTVRLLAQARRLAHPRHRRTVARRFTGDIGLRLNVRRTVAGLAAGQKGIYVDHAARRSTPDCDGTCPVVWLFDPSVVTESTWLGVVRDIVPEGRTVCNDFFIWCASRQRLGGAAEVMAVRAAYTCHLTTGILPYRDRTQQDIDAFKATYPARRRCLTPVEDDPEIRRFRGHEQAIACGVRYADDHVLVVSPEPLAPSAELSKLARERGVRIVPLSTASFDGDQLDRLSLYHSVPWRPRGWMAPPRWVYRHIPPTLV